MHYLKSQFCVNFELWFIQLINVTDYVILRCNYIGDAGVIREGQKNLNKIKYTPSK